MFSADRPVLVFDGDCGFCSSWAKWVAKGWESRAWATPWQLLDEDGLVELGLSVRQVEEAAWWLDGSNRLSNGHAAIGHSLLASRGWRRWAGAAILSPPFSWLAPAVYALVVRYRYRLPGGSPACRVQR